MSSVNIMTAPLVVTSAVTLQASLEAPAPLVDTLPCAGTPAAKDLGNESKSDILPFNTTLALGVSCLSIDHLALWPKTEDF